MENYIRKKIDENGDIRYFDSKNQFHRTNGPAFISLNEDKEWRINGLLHRLDGPAIEWGFGFREWWVSNKRYSKSKHNRLYLFSILEPRRIDLGPTED